MIPQASAILNNPDFTVASKEIELALVVLSVAELGFEDGARYDAICERAVERRFSLCPAEVGPQLRVQYPDQPIGEMLIVAMEAISGSDGSPHVFNVAHEDDGLWLYSSRGRPDDFWGGIRRFVFVHHR